MEVSTPIYRMPRTGSPQADGTAVLLQLGGIRFLVSAGHVLEDLRTQPLSAQAHDTIAPIAGDITYLSAPRFGNDPDPVDIRFVRLRGPDWESVPLERFLDVEEIVNEEILPKRDVFGLLGYPETKQRSALRGTTLEARAYRLLGLEAPAPLYRTLGLPPDLFLLIGFDKRRTWGPMGRVTAPDLYGASGCGLWHFGPRAQLGSHSPRLAAIGTRWERGHTKHIRGTRIRHVVTAMAERYPDVRSWLESNRGAV